MEITHSKYSAPGIQNSLAELQALIGGSDAYPIGESWPEPEPLGGKLIPVQSMAPEMLPQALRPMIEDVAERMQVPLDFPAVAAVATLAGMVNRRAMIQPKALDSSWIVVPNLWGCIIAEPGSMKSPIISSLTAPAKDLERVWLKEHQAATQAHQQEAETAELAAQAWREQSRVAFKKGEETPCRPAAAPEAPAQKRLLTADATFEKLHAMLAENPGGLFVLRDELAGWLAGLDRQGREQERTFYLEAWNGDQSYTLDRIGRGSVRVEHTCISLFGGIQPSRLRHYLADALRGGPANDGLMQRLQLLVWPDPTKQAWGYIDRQPNTAARDQAAAMYRRMALMDASMPALFRFDAEAQQLFIAWLTELENRIRAPHLGEIMKAHLSKYRKLMPALSLLFALAEGEQAHARLQHARLAASWCEYLETHAARVYSARTSTEQAAAMTLGQKIADGQLGKLKFKLRDLYRKCWSGLATLEEVRPAIRVLEEINWLRRVPSPAKTTGRTPSESYVINPLLEAHHAER